MAKSNPAPSAAQKPKKRTAVDLRAQAKELLVEAEAMDAEAHAKAHAPVSMTSDEGVSCLQLSPIELVNIDTRGLNATRFELHLGGRTFTHCGQRLDGAWMYRTV